MLDKFDKHTELNSSKIDSDFKFILNLLKDILIFLLTLIPYLLYGLLQLFLLNPTEAKIWFKKVFVFPFKILNNLSLWFFQAKFTAYLSLILIFAFLLQVIFLNTNEQLLQNFMTNPSHLTNLLFYTNLTSVFLHGNIFHLLTNLLGLIIFGRIVESHFKEKIIYLFLASGIIANLISNSISLYYQDFYFSLGASGAIAGLIIMAILLKPFQLTTIFLLPLPIFLIGWFLIYLDIIGLSNPSQTNNLAHIGGYLSLIFLNFFLELKQRKKIYLGLAINISLLVILYILNNVYGLSNLKSLIGF